MASAIIPKTLELRDSKVRADGSTVPSLFSLTPWRARSSTVGCNGEPVYKSRFRIDSTIGETACGIREPPRREKLLTQSMSPLISRSKKPEKSTGEKLAIPPPMLEMIPEFLMSLWFSTRTRAGDRNTSNSCGYGILIYDPSLLQIIQLLERSHSGIDA